MVAVWPDRLPPPETDHVTPLFEESFATEAVILTVCPAWIVGEDVGLVIVTVIGFELPVPPEPELELLLDPLQPERASRPARLATAQTNPNDFITPPWH